MRAPMLFVPNPHVRLDRDWAAPYVPLDLLSAMAVAEAAGVSTALFDVNRLVQQGRLTVSPAIWTEAAALLAEAEPALVLLDTWTGTLHNTLQLVACARRQLPSVPLLLCGAGTSAQALRVLAEHADLDGVIRGEPEPAIAALCTDPPRGRALPAAPGLLRRDAAGALRGAELAWVEDLDALPWPAYHLALLRPGDAIPVEPGRGCAQGCTFCALAGYWPPRHRHRAPAAIAAQMRALHARFPGSTLDLTQDPVFFGEPARLRALCDALVGSGVRWSGHARVDRLDRDGLQRLAAAGCAGLLFGVESGCPAMQQRIRKHVDLEYLAPTIATATALGIECRASFVVGFPGEDPASLGRTARAALTARQAGAASTPVQLLRAYPGAAIHEQHAGDLVLEPLLHTAAAEDAAGRALIAAAPELLCASYRVELGQQLPAPRLLAAQLCLSALLEALDALDRHGVPVERLLARLALDPAPADVADAVRQLAEQLAALAAGEALVDPIALRDLLRYEVALFEVAQEPAPELGELDEAALPRLRSAPASVFPYAAVPWRLVLARTDVERLVEGRLSPAPRAEQQRLLVAKVPASGEAAHYSRRGFALETFLLDEVGAALLPLCDGELDLERIAQRIGLQQGWSPSRTLADCCDAAEELLRDGVLDLALRRP